MCIVQILTKAFALYHPQKCAIIHLDWMDMSIAYSNQRNIIFLIANLNICLRIIIFAPRITFTSITKTHSFVILWDKEFCKVILVGDKKSPSLTPHSIISYNPILINTYNKNLVVMFVEIYFSPPSSWRWLTRCKVQTSYGTLF